MAALNNFGAINILANMNIDSEGKVSLDSSTSRTKGFPSIEGYAYRIIQAEPVIQVLFKNPEDEPGALNGPMDEPLVE